MPSISYTFLFTRRVGLEAGISAQSITYTLNINKESVGNLMNKTELDNLADSLEETLLLELLSFVFHFI